MVRLLFTSGDMVGSRLISAAARSKASHMALLLSYESEVYHFTLDGLAIDNLPTFLEHRQVVTEVNLPFENELQRALFVTQFKKLLPIQHCYGYDYGAIAWWAWQSMLTRVTGKHVGERNKGNRRYEFLCTEMLYFVTAAYVEAVGRYLYHSNVDIAALSPDQVAALLTREVPQ